MFVHLDFSLCHAYINIDNIISLPLLYMWNFIDTNYVCCQFLSFCISFSPIRHCYIVTSTAIGVLSPGLHVGVRYLQKVVEVPGTPVNVI
jgi:hypothetical protein